MEKVLFITNKMFIDLSKREGGVRNCTLEFIQLLQRKFEVILFPVEYNLSWPYRVRAKLGLNHYSDYNPEKYFKEIAKLVEEHNTRFIFLNLSNTIKFSSVVKKIRPGNIKVILCSHGNETGDYLHQVVRFAATQFNIKKLFSSYTLGKLLKIEAYYRISDLDMVLSISEVEEQIEKWLGARQSFMVPRTIKKELLQLNPVLNRVGFIGDISHTPNYTGIIALCDALSARKHTIELRLVGSPEKIGEKIARKYSFVTYCGYLPGDKLVDEIVTWTYFLNLVFYYSRGVSTKLAKALSWGLPVISTEAGNRGYQWREGTLPIAENADDMARIIIENAGDMQKIKSHQEQVKLIVNSSPDHDQIMDRLYPKIMAL